MTPQHCIGLLDLTTLSDTDTDDSVRALCAKAHGMHGSVAAVCLYPQFVKTAKAALAGTNIKVATVANFPTGKDNPSAVLVAIQTAIADGADEIDVVLPYESFVLGHLPHVSQFIEACKTQCGDTTLKVILESGILPSEGIVAAASQLCIDAGANFLKTSTGKVPIGATLDAAEAMLNTIKQNKKPVGFKASGGIRTWDDAQKYLALAEKIMGKDWVTPKTFRFGASSLLGDLVTVTEALG